MGKISLAESSSQQQVFSDLPRFGVGGFLRSELKGTGIFVRRGGVGLGVVTATVVGGSVGGLVGGFVTTSGVVFGTGVVVGTGVIVGTGVVVGGFVSSGVVVRTVVVVGGLVTFVVGACVVVVEMIAIGFDSTGKNGGKKKVGGGVWPVF